MTPCNQTPQTRSGQKWLKLNSDSSERVFNIRSYFRERWAAGEAINEEPQDGEFAALEFFLALWVDESLLIHVVTSGKITGKGKSRSEC